MMKNLTLLIFLLALSVNQVYAQDLDSMLKSVPNQEAFWSLTVLDEDGKKMESYNSDKLIIPASNQKLYTLAAVLGRLGSDFRYTTNIYGKGELVDSTWQGDLIIKGSGDPSISGILYDDDREYVFKELLKQLNMFGIKDINGSLYSDINYFDEEIYPVGWDWHDLSFYYGVEIAPLSFNNNAFDLIVNAEGEVGDKPEITVYPELDMFEVLNEQVIISFGKEYDEFYRRRLGSNEIVLASKLPQNYIETESLSINNAGLFFLSSFELFLKKNGIENITSSSLDVECSSVGFSIVLASHTSKPLSELVNWANKESDNFYTEMLLKTLAAEKQGIPGTFENGIKEVRGFLAEQGVDTNLVKMNDGSGLAMGNYTTTGNISRLLYSMKSHQESEVFYNSLPIAGIDGSIAHRFKGTELYNNLRAKTGYVSGVRTLSGYMTTSSGKKITFSLATNHFVGKVKPVDYSHQQILEYLYQKY
tara:strand:- start:14534 stop:15961 length:1428 start_codon:yes stop_codon:yes gene_type:complete